MGDVQSTQRGSGQDAAAEEDSRDANHPQTEQNADHENSEQTSDFSRKGDEVKMNGCCEDENGAQGLPLIPTKEAAPDTQRNKEELQREGDNDGMHLEITEMDVKQNEMNPFGRIFSNIGLKLTINRGLGEMARNDGKRINTEKSEQTKTEKTEDKAEGQTVQEGSDPACSILTGVTSSEVLGGSDKTVKAAEEPEGEADSVAGTQEDEPHSTNSSGPGDVEIDSPIRKFFATGSFAGLWKKKEPDDEPTEKELEEVGGSQAIETTGQTVQQQHEGKVTPPGEHKENELRGEMLAKTPECDILSSQERDRVQMSPLLRFLSGSSLKRLSMKQRNVKSSEARLCDSGEHPPELLPSDPAEDHRNASSPTSAEAAKDEEGPWASFKRFMSPKPRMKKSYHSAEETQQPAPVEELKAEQTSDHSSEEGKKRKNSSVSWEAVLCGSGRRRSRKTSDSEDEMPPIDLKHRKEDAGAKSGGESGAENEKETSSSFKQDGTLQEGDGGSAWKSLKRIVTPKRKSRDEDERMKINLQPDAEGAEENSSFSIKNLLPGRKKQRSEESQGPVSSGESRKGLASDDEDSETPGVVPLSEFEVDEEEKESLDEGERSELQKEQVARMNLCFPQDFNEASEKQEDANKGPDEVTKSAGKHQQLSDIQEEGVNTEPGATVTSVPEEVEVRDDAMAEDLIEVASEAFTALEPAADITLQDETEMFTAVSQFSSESAKTSGNATPVPAESDIIETDTLLHQVAETFLTDPKTTTLKPEQIFEAFVEKDSAVHELQRRPGATPNETGLNVKDLETISRLVSASLREGVSKVAEVNSAGFGPTEELDRAETTLEDVCMISVTQESTNDNEKNIPVSPVEQVEVKSVMDDCQEPVLINAIGATIEKGDLEQEVQTLTENGDLTKHGIHDHPEDEDEKQPSAEVEGVRDPAEALASGGVVELGEHADMLPLTEETVVQEPEETEDPAEGHVPSHEPNVISDNISMCSGIETGGDKPEAEPRLLTEAIVEQLDASKSVEEPEDLQAEQASSSNLQEGNMSLDEPQIVSENLARADADKDEADKTQVLTETLELMEAPQETEVLQAVQERSANGDVIVLLLETELIPEKGSKAEDVFEPQALLKSATEADISQPYQASSEMSAEINDSDQIVQLQELNNSTDLTEDALGALEVNASKTVEEPEVLQTASSLGSDKGNITSVETNEKPDSIPKEELHLDENEKETINTEDTMESMEASTIAQEPELMKPPALASEDIVLPPETVIILKADLDTDEHKTQSTLITEEAADAPKVEEPELAQSVQLSPLESEESIGGPLEREITSDNISEEQTTTDDPPGETIIEAVDDSKTQILEELQTVQTSSLVREESSISPYETEDTSDGTLTAEGHIAENKGDKMLHTDYSIETEDEVKVLQEAEELKIVFETSPDEPEDVKIVATEILFEKEHFKTVQTSSFVSEEISIPSIDPEGTSENLLKADLETEEHKMQTNLVTEDTSELLDDPHSVEEAELSPPVQPSCEESENIHDPLLEAEAISHNTPKAETVQEETNEEIILDHVSEEERVHEEPIEEGHTNLQSEDPSETVQEAKALQALQQSLASEETEEATSANLTEEETVHSELKAETPVAAETISESGDESNAAETVEELRTVQTSSLVSEEHGIPALEAEESSENLHGAESDRDEHKVEMVLVPGDASAPKTPEVPELSQTVQMCSLALGDNETSSDEPEKTSEVILKGETRPDKPRAETTVAGKTINEPENESKTAEVIEELKTVETSPLVSENSSKSTLKAEDTSEEISEVQPDTVENQVEPVLVTVETSEPKTAEEPEPSLQLTVQSSSLESEDNNIPSAEPEMTSEIICKEETVPDEPKEELKLHSEKPLEPEDPSEAVGGAEASSAVNPQSESEEIKLETSDNISEEERVTDEPRDETTLVIETSMEPVDESKYAEQVEELQTLQISSVVKEESRISLYEPEDSSENTLSAQIDVDENKVEICLDAKETSELVPPKEPESSLQVTVQSSSLESEDNNIPSAEPEITSEIIHKEETVPDELEPESKTAEVLEEQQTVQTPSLVEYKSIIPPLEAEEPSDNIPKAEIVLEEPEEEITLDPENTKTAEEPQALTAEPPTPEAEPPSLGNRATCDHFPAEETVPDEPKEETIPETLDASEPVQELELIQEVLVPSLASDELEGKSNNGAEAETDTVLLSQVHHKPGDVHKPEVLEPVQAVSLESVAASDETQATSEKIPEAETNPEDEDLRVETAADELNLHHPIKLVEPEEDLPVEEARTGPDHTAEVPLDKSESEDHVGETSEHKPETVPQDNQIKHEGSTPEEFQTLTAGQISEEPVVSVETRHLSEEQVITEEVKGDKYLGTETEAAEDEDPAAPQIDTCHPEEGGPDILMGQTSQALMEEEDEAAPPTVRDGVAEDVKEGKAEDEDAAEIGEVDVDIKSEGTPVDWLQEVDRTEAMEVCCSVPPTVSVTEEEERKNVDSKEEETVEGRSSRGELDTEVKCLTPGFRDEELCDVSPGQQESKHLLQEIPGCLESIHEDPLDEHDRNEGEVKEKESVEAKDASAGPPGTKKEAVDQDEEMDGDVQKETAGSFDEVEEPLESQRGDEDMECAGLEETTQASRVGEESGERNRAEGACRSEREGNDSDVAPEHPGNTSTTTVSLTG